MSEFVPLMYNKLSSSSHTTSCTVGSLKSTVVSPSLRFRRLQEELEPCVSKEYDER